MVLTASFLAGIIAHAFDETRWSAVTALFLGGCLSAAAAVLRRQNASQCLLLACLTLFVWGLVRYDTALPSGHDPRLPEGEMMGFEGVAAEVPRRGLYRTEVELDRVVSVSTDETMPGRWRLDLLSPATVAYGDRLTWTCQPRNVLFGSDGFDTRLYLHGIRFRCRPRDPPTVIGSDEGHPLLGVIYAIKVQFQEAVFDLYPDPEASFLLGLLMGSREGIPDRLTEDFRMTGTSHILAVSGYNVTQLIRIAVVLAALCAIPRRRASAGVAVLVLCFALLVGDDASVVRASIMGSVAVLATLCGRLYGGFIALSVAAAVMLAFNPLILRHDVGFQLSFCAVWGLYAFGERFTAAMTDRPFLSRTLLRTAAETLAATLATLPVILLTFGRFPLGAPLVNIMVLPLLPFIMAGGLVSASLHLIHGSLGWLTATVTFALLRWEISVVTVASRLLPPPLEMRATPLQTGLMYLFLMAVWLSLSDRRRSDLATVRGATVWMTDTTDGRRLR
ncbi:hypothetical protein AMJ57_03160 [Parcubacteria bacterium SG8_24]|nr:MAG: hypothetical protein AMJ57_03160 [Parcubacteria bacterium SG8_24]